MRKRNSDPLFSSTEGITEKRERKTTLEDTTTDLTGAQATMEVETKNGNGQTPADDEEMINVVDVSDSESADERMDSSDVVAPSSSSSVPISAAHQHSPVSSSSVSAAGASAAASASASFSALASSLLHSYSAAASLPLDLSKKKRRLTASTSLTEENDPTRDDDLLDDPTGNNSESDHQRQRKGNAGFSGIRGGSFGAGSSSSSSSSASSSASSTSSSTIKWRMKPLECDTPSRGQSPSVMTTASSSAAADSAAAAATAAAAALLQVQQQSLLITNHHNNSAGGVCWSFQQRSSSAQSRPSVIRSADFTFEPPESTDVDEHFRKSLSGGGQVTTEADAKVDDHFARALGDVWWALKTRMHLTPTDEGPTPHQRSSPSPASIIQTQSQSGRDRGKNVAHLNSPAAADCVSLSSSAAALPQTSPNVEGSSSLSANTKSSSSSSNSYLLSTAFPCSTPLKKRILSKAAVEAAARRLELSATMVTTTSPAAGHANNNIDHAAGHHGIDDTYSDHINNNNNNNNHNNSTNGSNSDEDSRKSISAPDTPPPTPL